MGLNQHVNVSKATLILVYGFSEVFLIRGKTLGQAIVPYDLEFWSLTVSTRSTSNLLCHRIVKCICIVNQYKDLRVLEVWFTVEASRESNIKDYESKHQLLNYHVLFQNTIHEVSIYLLISFRVIHDGFNFSRLHD